MKSVTWSDLSDKARQSYLARPAPIAREQQLQQVREIIATVQQNGDQACLAMTATFDKVSLQQMRVPVEKIAAAQQQLSAEQIKALEVAAHNIKQFHEAQRPHDIRVETQPGIVCEKRYHPLERVGLYVPGGSAPLPSTVLMTALPAQIAGCPIRVLCTPPQADGCCHPAILAAAHLCGIEQIYLIGGAQAIAAMAYGTDTIPKVDKIFGPGNSWVTLAKTLVSQDPLGAAIDMPAGPSEVMVIADANANPEFIAADLLSQAEHGPDSQVILISDDPAMLQACCQATVQQCQQLSRRHIAEQSLQHSVAILVDELQTAMDIANDYAPEHLILHLDAFASWQDSITRAGSVFLGPWAPESMGDYASGTNHVLPTNGFARVYSGLSLLDYMRSTTFQQLTARGFQDLAGSVATLANMEGLDAHANAVGIRQRALTEEQSHG